MNSNKYNRALKYVGPTPQHTSVAGRKQHKLFKKTMAWIRMGSFQGSGFVQVIHGVTAATLQPSRKITRFKSYSYCLFKLNIP